MSDGTTIRGKIIRILDTSTVVINLGASDGVSPDSVFRVLAPPENIVDPDTGDVLGTLALVKVRLKADRVYDRFTVAKSKWTSMETSLGGLLNIPSVESVLTPYQKEVELGRELRVEPSDIQPWRAVSEDTVRIGDVVEVFVVVSEPEPKADVPSAGTSEGPRS